VINVETNVTNLHKIIYKYVTKKRPLMIWGTMGIGKSDSVRAVAKKVAEEKKKEYIESAWNKTDFCLIDIRISQLDPSDLRGIPFPVDGKTKFLKPDWLPEAGEGILFFDEINLAPVSIQSACYQLILNRRLGDYVLPEGWTIVSAGNRSTDNASVFNMNAPLKNRFSHVTLLPPSTEEWTLWALDNNICSDIIAFLNFKQDALFKFDAKSKDDAFATPRTWQFASDMISDLSLDGVHGEQLNTRMDEIRELVATCIGDGTAFEYYGFLKCKINLDIKDILEHPIKAQDITQPDLIYVLCSTLAEKYKHDKKLLEKILDVCEYVQPEFSVFLMRLIKAISPLSFVDDVSKLPAWSRLFPKIGKYFFN
jgi:hypothetical protein